MTKPERHRSYLLVLAGLFGLLVTLPWWLYVNAPSFGLPGAVVGGSLVPALLMYAVYARTRNWSGITALCMIPVAVVGVMDVVANLAAPEQGLVIAVLGITVFLTALDAGRRSPNR